MDLKTIDAIVSGGQQSDIDDLLEQTEDLNLKLYALTKLKRLEDCCELVDTKLETGLIGLSDAAVSRHVRSVSMAAVQGCFDVHVPHV